MPTIAWSSPKVTSEEGPREKALTPDTLRFSQSAKGKVMGVVKPAQGAEGTNV
jgi:hypothetical protein